jgi:fucose 4-O-acetylase-like acetyltransferase
MEYETKYYGGIDIFRHILALCVIFLHMGSDNRFNAEILEVHKNLCYYIQSAVAGFFLISGFFFHIDKTFLIFLRKKFKRIMLPFFIFSLLYTVLMALLGKGTLLGGLERTFLLDGVGPQIYFLPYLFYIQLSFFIFYKISATLKVNFLSILIPLIICLIFTSVLLPTDYITGPGYDKLIFYSMCFWFGVLISKLHTYYSIIIILIIFYVGFYDFRYFHVSALIVLLIAAIWFSERFKLLQKKKSGSGGIYLLHQPITSNAISIILVAFGVSSYCNMFLSWILTYVFCLLLTLLLIRLLPSKRWALLE